MVYLFQKIKEKFDFVDSYQSDEEADFKIDAKNFAV